MLKKEIRYFCYAIIYNWLIMSVCLLYFRILYNYIYELSISSLSLHKDFIPTATDKIVKHEIKNPLR